jgi:hypothetical protein
MKIINQIMDLIVYKFLELVIKNTNYNVYDFFPDLQMKIIEVINWIERKSALLNIALQKNNQDIKNNFRAERNDSFSFGNKRKSNQLIDRICICQQN